MRKVSAKSLVFTPLFRSRIERDRRQELIEEALDDEVLQHSQESDEEEVSNGVEIPKASQPSGVSEIPTQVSGKAEGGEIP